MPDFTSIQGLHIYQARKVARFVFPNHFFTMTKNTENQSFDLYLTKDEDINKDAIAWYKKYWGSGFRVFLVDPDNVG